MHRTFSNMPKSVVRKNPTTQFIYLTGDPCVKPFCMKHTLQLCSCSLLYNPVYYFLLHLILHLNYYWYLSVQSQKMNRANALWRQPSSWRGTENGLGWELLTPLFLLNFWDAEHRAFYSQGSLLRQEIGNEWTPFLFYICSYLPEKHFDRMDSSAWITLEL